jgi:Zn finger protein HypA/HybF involved in hydrogenase expression
MDWKKYSNRLIEVSKSYCPHCEKPFYELDGYELSDCPHCEQDLGSIDYDSQTSVRIFVDFKTGEVKMHKETI